MKDYGYNRSITPDAYLNYPIVLVLMHPPCSYRQVAFDTLTRNAKTWKHSIDANTVHAVQSAIHAGLRVSVLPLSAVQDDMPLISEALPPLPNTCVMNYLNPDVSQPCAERFIDYLLAGIEGAVDQREQMKFRASS